MGINFIEFREWLSTIGKDLSKEDVQAFVFLLKDEEIMNGNWWKYAQRQH